MTDTHSTGVGRTSDRSNGCFSCSPGQPTSGNILIDTQQIFDCCRDRDCFEDTRVFLDEAGQCLIERAGQIRVRTAEVISSSITVDPVRLSRGFYRIDARFFVRLECEACLFPGGSQCFNGLAVCEKSVVLYGGEGNVHVFRSNASSDSFCSPHCEGEMTNNLPVAVVETVDPVVLSAEIVEPSRCHCCLCGEELTPAANRLFGGNIAMNGNRYLAVSLGFFSVIRLERPEQYLINATEYSVPDKECLPDDDDSPCDAFHRMAFPIEEFAPGRIGLAANPIGRDTGHGCGCHHNEH